MLDTVITSKKLRDPNKVMRLDRMGSMHQCRLSFMRTLMRRLKKENWKFDCPIFDFDEKGIGVGVYTAKGPVRTYSLICFGHDLKPEERSDRVIAHKWDSTFTLFDGVPTQADIDRLSKNVPKQEAGRVSNSEISVSRANRSVRLFNHVVEALSSGHQPDAEQVGAVGYLMRTTAVYGSGKLGAADRELIADREELASPFQAELLSVYLTRAYTLDLVEHMAKLRSPDTAVTIDPALRRTIGVGNSTGLGMAPYMVNHPALLNNWVAAREKALALVCGLESASPETKMVFKTFLQRAQLNTAIWSSEHPLQVEKVKGLAEDLLKIESHIETGVLDQSKPWQTLYDWGEENLSLEGQEQLVSLILEPHGVLVDKCENEMKVDETKYFAIKGAMKLSRLNEILKNEYGWVLNIDWNTKAAQEHVWYVSAEKLEPRIGKRQLEPVSEYEQALAPGRDAKLLYDDLVKWQGDDTVAAFLLKHPEHRHIVRRVQITAQLPYAEIRDNTIAHSLLPIDILRFKLAFFGATHFDPRSDRWVRINMFKNAPFPTELENCEADDWSYPQLEEQTA